MAISYKVLGQSAPSATTLTTLYTVPAATSTVVSTITVANRDSGATTFRIAVRPAGAGIATSQYVSFDAPILGNDTISLTLGITLATSDVLSVYGGTANLTFNAFGAENT